ncbi:MAG: pilus assembly protein PilP [Deltaproteobacteria bacterium]|nr:pilus assembly protein PilP [Deltaproteobacteria bacterium]
MKKITFIFLNAFIIVFISAISVFAADVKKPLTSPSTAKAVPASAMVQPQVKALPAPVAVQTKPAAANIPAQGTVAQSAAANAAAAATPPESYSYSPLGKPDPFRPFIVMETAEQKKAKVQKKAAISMFPLQRAETSMYKVVGIAGDQYNRVAIAEDSAKKFYPLLKGTRIGLQNGKVVEIMADRVIVEEYEGKKARRVILKLRKN